MKENELYVTDKGVFIGIVQHKEMIIVDRGNAIVRDPLYDVETQLIRATPEQVEHFQRLENVKTAVAEDKRTTGAVHDLTGTNTSGAKRI